MGLDYLSYREDMRSNQARESENTRHNQTAEGLELTSIGETIRNNQFRNSLDTQVFGETVRNNKVRNNLETRGLEETIWKNRADNVIRTADVNETILSDRNTEAIRQGELNEKQRQYNVAILPAISRDMYGLRRANDAGDLTDGEHKAGGVDIAVQTLGRTMKSLVGLGGSAASLEGLLQ